MTVKKYALKHPDAKKCFILKIHSCSGNKNSWVSERFFIGGLRELKRGIKPTDDRLVQLAIALRI